MPEGKAPKKHRILIGPYYIANNGPNHTFKLRRCSHNREEKSMINTTQLKLYFDIEDRPTNPLSEWEDFNQPLNQEEFPNEDYIEHTDQDLLPVIQRIPNYPSKQKQTDQNIFNGEPQKAKNTEREKAPNKHDDRNSVPKQNMGNQTPKQTQQPIKQPKQAQQPNKQPKQSQQQSNKPKQKAATH